MNVDPCGSGSTALVPKHKIIFKNCRIFFYCGRMIGTGTFATSLADIGQLHVPATLVRLDMPGIVDLAGPALPTLLTFIRALLRS